MTMHRIRRYAASLPPSAALAALLFVLALPAPPSAGAQTLLGPMPGAFGTRMFSFDTTAFPWISMTVKFFDGDRVLRSADDVSVTVLENGADQNATISCTTEPFSAVLVLDCSQTMADYPNTNTWDPDSTRWHGAKSALHAFIDQMLSLDQAALVSFSTNVTTSQALTTDKRKLHDALEGLRLSRGTAAWKATQQAVNLVATQSGSKAVILLTDGEDNASGFVTSTAVTTLAKSQGVLLFTIGLGQDAGRAQLSAMATGTGGAYYYTADPDSLTAVYRDITAKLAGGCTVTYRSTNPCNDGVRRDVRLLASRAAATAEADTLYYAPNTTPSVVLRLEPRAVVASGSRFSLPVVITSGWRSDEPLRLQATLRYPADLLSEPVARLRYPLPEDGASVAVSPPGTALVTVAVDSLPLRDSVLLDLEFIAADLAHPKELSFSLTDVSAMQDCLLLVAGSASTVIIDGRCSALVSRSSGLLLAPYPNPSAAEVVIPLSLSSASDHHAVLRIVDGYGRTVATLLDGTVAGGASSVVWNAGGAASGTYLIELVADGQRDAKRVVVAR
jgi:hypothetical protein